MLIRKRLSFFIACLALCLAVFPTSTAAANTLPSIMPRMTYIKDADCTLTLSSTSASVYAYVNGYANTATKCEVTVELQERSLLFFWDTVETWSVEETGQRATISQTASVTSGTTYRAVATVTVWSGSQSETQTLTSDTVKAP